MITASDMARDQRLMAQVLAMHRTWAQSTALELLKVAAVLYELEQSVARVELTGERVWRWWWLREGKCWIVNAVDPAGVRVFRVADCSAFA